MEEQQSKIKANIYDKLLIMFIVLQIFGNFGGALQPVRIFAFVFILPMFLYFATKRKKLRENIYSRNVFIIWLVYGFLSLFVSIRPGDSIKELMYLSLNFSVFFVLIYFANKANKPTESIIKGWIYLFLLTIPIALFEFTFDKHFALSLQEEDMLLNYGSDIVLRRFASVTYGNLNTYNTMLMFIFPFIISPIFNNKNKKDFSKKIFIIVAFCLIVLMNGSRGAVIGLAIGFLVFLSVIVKNKKLFAITLIVVFIIGILGLHFFGNIFSLITDRFETQGLEDEGRLGIIISSYDAFINSYFLGIGAGNFSSFMEKNYNLDILAPHNFFLEILVQYGLFIFLLFIGILIRIIKKTVKNKNVVSRFIIISSLCMFPITTIINSTYILGIWIWLFIGSLYIISDSNYDVLEN